MPQAHAGSILIPLDPYAREVGLYGEYQKSRKKWTRTKNKKLPGRALVVQNLPIKTEKGKTEHWSPLQAACMALSHYIDQRHDWDLVGTAAINFDVIRVQTPGQDGIPGEQAISDWDFSVAELLKTMKHDDTFFPSVIDGKVQLEDKAVNIMPNKWALSPSGVWAPTI